MYTKAGISLNYDNRTLDAVYIGGELWFTATDLAREMGIANPRQVARLYTRNAHRFFPDEVKFVPVKTTQGFQHSRVFSLRGAVVLSFMGQGRRSKAFGRWLLDLLDGRRHYSRSEKTLPPGTHALATETVRLIEQAVELIDEGHAARQILTELRDGVRELTADPLMERLIAELGAARALHGEANRAYRAVARSAAQDGYTMDGIKAAARREARHAG